MEERRLTLNSKPSKRKKRKSHTTGNQDIQRSSEVHISIWGGLAARRRPTQNAKFCRRRPQIASFHKSGCQVDFLGMRRMSDGSWSQNTNLFLTLGLVWFGANRHDPRDMEDWKTGCANAFFRPESCILVLLSAFTMPCSLPRPQCP